MAIRTFRDVSVEPSFDYYAASMADEIRSRLSLLRSMRTMGRAVADRYHDGDLPRLRSEAGVEYVLAGNVAATRQKVDLNLELRDTGTRKTVWSRRYDYAPGRLEELRGTVAMDIANAVGARVTADERRRLELRPTAQPEAYDLYLQAGRAARMRTTDALARRAGLLKQAVDLDPTFSDAVAEISYVLVEINDPTRMPESLNWARKALAANPASANAYYALASVYMATGEFSKSRAAFRRCLELDENNTSALNNLSLVETSLANYDEALRLGRHAMVLNPYEPGNYYHLGSSVRIIGSREQQAKWLEVWRARFPRYVRTLTAQVSAEFTYGSRELAMAEMRKILQVHKGNREVDWTAADIAMACSAPDAEELVRRASGGVLDANYGQYSIFPESPRARLAWFLLKRGDRAGRRRCSPTPSGKRPSIGEPESNRGLWRSSWRPSCRCAAMRIRR